MCCVVPYAHRPNASVRPCNRATVHRAVQKRKAKDVPAKLQLSAADQAILDAATKHNVAVQELKTAVALGDLFLYVLDARNPLAFRCAAIEQALKSRPKPHSRVLLILNKSGNSLLNATLWRPLPLRAAPRRRSAIQCIVRD